MEAIQYSKQKGFTLVEIAIVMVIIGLLLGAVLKGQNLINSARVRSMADQNSSVQAAYYGFIDRYRAIPGDMTAARACEAIGANQFGASSCPGSTPGGSGTTGGNGRLDLGDYAEASAVWAHLSAANFIVGSYPGGATSSTYDDEGMAPKNPFEGRVILWRTASYQSSTGTSGERLGFVIGRSTPASVMLELDEKVDDGRPQTGVLRIADTGSAVDNGVAACLTSGTTTGTSSNIWDVSSDSQDCNAVYLY